jgi:transcriptional regulator GlxA family with amidase domain
MMSICTGAFALAGAGLLGRSAATHWAAAAELADTYPEVDVDPDVLYVDNGQILTGAGLAAGIDLCLHVVRQDHGATAAAELARTMVVAPYRDGGQAQFLAQPLPPAGDGLARTCAWMITRLGDPVTVEDMARHAGWARRTFARRFLAETGTTPLRWLASQRLNHARRLLETTVLPIEQIAGLSGFGTGANLRLHFSRRLGVTPTTYRRTYQGVSA